MVCKNIQLIKEVLGSVTTEQHVDINYDYNHTDIGIEREDVKTPIKTDPLNPIMKGIEYNRTK